MHLPFKSFPGPLKWLTILWLVSGVLGIVVRSVQYLQGASGGFRILVAVGTLWSACDIYRGRREGVGYMLLLHGMIAGVLIYGWSVRELAFAPGWFGALSVWVLGVTVYLGWCWFRLPWRKDGEGDPASECVSRLVAMYDDPVGQQAAVVAAVEAGELSSNPTALQVALDLLSPETMEAHARDLEPCLDVLDVDDCSELMGALARTGDAAWAGRVAQGLRCEHSRKLVAEGLVLALDGNRCHPDVVQVAEPLVRHYVSAELGGPECSAVLARLDSGFAHGLLSTAELRTEERCAEMHSLVGILESGYSMDARRTGQLLVKARQQRAWWWVHRLVDAGVSAHPHTDDWLGEIEGDLEGADARRAYVSLLGQMVAERGHEAEPLLGRVATELSVPTVTNGAARMLAELHGFPEGVWMPDGVGEAIDLEGLWCVDAAHWSANQGVLATVQAIHWHLRHGGFLALVANASRGEMERLVPSVQALAPEPVLSVLERGFECLSGGGLEPDEGVRMDWIDDRHDQVADQLEQVDEDYRRLDYLLEAAFYLFAVEHRDEILPAMVG